MKKNSDFKELANVSIASPCSADWNKMRGDEKQRFCNQCSLFVYDISAMSAGEAEDFLAKNQKACLRLYQREDGKVLTQDCPVGLARVTAGLRRLKQWAAGIAACLISFCTLPGQADDASANQNGGACPSDTTNKADGKTASHDTSRANGRHLMGKRAATPRHHHGGASSGDMSASPSNKRQISQNQSSRPKPGSHAVSNNGDRDQK